MIESIKSKTAKILVGFMIGLLIVMSVQTLLNKPREAHQEGVRFFESDDSALLAAIKQARSKFGKVEKALKHPDKEVFVKIGLPAVSGSTEHIWVIKIKSLGSGNYEGEINNDPIDLDTIKLGDRVKFDVNNVSDWIIENPDGTREGEFTLELVSGQ